MFDSNKNPITLFVALLIIWLIQPFVHISFQTPNFWYLIVFTICSTLFFWLMQNVSWHHLYEDKEISNAKLILYDTMEVAKPYYHHIKTIITKKRNQRICNGIQHVIRSDKSTKKHIDIEVIKNSIENGTIDDIVDIHSFSHKNKRSLRRYLKKYNNNTDDLDKLKKEYETKDLLRNDIDIKSIVSLVIGIILSIVGLLSLNAFLEFLYVRIINIVIMLIIDAVYIMEEYYKRKRFLLEYYFDVNELIEEAIIQAQKEQMEELTNGKTENVQSEQG